MMHLDHDHPHPHDHPHEHHHEHPHDHDHCAPESCKTCPGCGEHTPKEELMALMQYMVNHNTAHANELAGLAKKLEESGDKAACDQVMLAVSDFEKGNLRLSAILASMRG